LDSRLWKFWVSGAEGLIPGRLCESVEMGGNWELKVEVVEEVEAGVSELFCRFPGIKLPIIICNRGSCGIPVG